MAQDILKTALITGAGKGIGEVVARQLHAAGFAVGVSGTNENHVRNLAEQIDASGARAFGLELDVCEKADFVAALAAMDEKFGGCHVLVNNAALTPTTPLMDISEKEFDDVLRVNLRGTFFGCQVFGARFGEQKHGRIINMASLAGQMGGTASGAHYAASKGGILTLTKLFARHLAADGVTVNAIAPGPVDVPSIREKVPEEKLQEIVQTMIPVQQMSEPEFIGEMILLLVSEAAATVTGACWDINGGIYMR